MSFFALIIHSKQFEEEETTVSAAVPDISQAEEEISSIESEQKELSILIPESQENDHNVLLAES